MMLIGVFTTLLVGWVAAQDSSSSSSSSSSSNSSSFDPNSVDLTTRNQWCSGETANCPMLCGGMTSTTANQCFGQTLKYTCTCANGSEPASIAQYQDTIPNHICQATFAQCRQANPGSDACKTCGTLKAADVPTASSSSSAAASTTMESSTTGATPATTSKASEGNVKAVEGVALAGAGLLAAVFL